MYQMFATAERTGVLYIKGHLICGCFHFQAQFQEGASYTRKHLVVQKWWQPSWLGRVSALTAVFISLPFNSNTSTQRLDSPKQQECYRLQSANLSKQRRHWTCLPTHLTRCPSSPLRIVFTCDSFVMGTHTYDFSRTAGNPVSGGSSRETSVVTHTPSGCSGFARCSKPRTPWRARQHISSSIASCQACRNKKEWSARKLRSKHIKGWKECYLLGQNATGKFLGQSPLSSCKMTHTHTHILARCQHMGWGGDICGGKECQHTYPNDNLLVIHKLIRTWVVMSAYIPLWCGDICGDKECQLTYPNDNLLVIHKLIITWMVMTSAYVPLWRGDICGDN